MVRESYWSQLKEFLQLYKPFVDQVREREKDIIFKNESMISLKSLDAPDKIRGISGKAAVSFIILDEFSFLRNAKDLYQDIILPYKANTAVEVKILNISTPKGLNFFHELYERGLSDNYPDHTSLRYSCYDVQPEHKEYWDSQKKAMTERAFKQEYLAEFNGSGNQAFYAWDRNLHIDPSIKDVKNGENLIVAVDGNYGIMSHILARVTPSDNDQFFDIEIIKEVEGKHKNVQQLIDDINKTYRDDMGCSITVCPDASMNQKNYAASIGVTGISLFREAGWLVKAPNRNPSHLDSVQAVNNQLYNGIGEVHLTVHPSCVNLMKSIEMASWSEMDGHKLSKTTTSAEGHSQDSLRYLVNSFKTRKSTISTFRNIQTF